MATSRHSVISEKHPLSSPDTLQTLPPSLHSPPPPPLTKPFLQKLYLSLLHLPNPNPTPSHISLISSHLFSKLSHRWGSFQNPSGSKKLELGLLLLRCCLVMLKQLEQQPTLLVDKSRQILDVLRGTRGHSYFNLRVLEVFLDEILLSRQLRGYLMLVDDGQDRMFRDDAGCDDGGVVLEVVSAHFVAGVRSGFVGNENESVQLSLSSAVQLLGTPIMGSAPPTFQGYVISMVSRCISVDRDLDDGEVGEIRMEYYISAFEKSLILHAGQLACLGYDKPSACGGESWPPFESYIRPIRYDAINEVADFAGSVPSVSFKSKAEFVTACDVYIKENKKVLNKSFRNEIHSVLNSVVSQILVSKVEDIVFCTRRDASPQEIYLLASIVDLMGNSLMQIVQCLVRGSLPPQRQNLTHNRSFCKGYDFIIGIVGCFLEYCVNDSAQKLLKVVGFNSTKLMLIHFASFLPFSYGRGHEYLRKCCLLVMMAIMNLIIFEDGDLEALKTLLSSMERSLSANSATKSSKASNSSRIASKFQKLRNLHSRNASKVEICNGENFLKSLNLKQPDIDDLADFVECKKEKDYTKYLETRENYRKWKHARRLVRKRERRKNTQKAFTGNMFNIL